MVPMPGLHRLPILPMQSYAPLRVAFQVEFLVFVIIGPIEVLLPFVAADQANGGPGGYALVLAAFGLGGAIASIIVASLKLPRRYLTVMTLSWL